MASVDYNMHDIDGTELNVNSLDKQLEEMDAFAVRISGIVTELQGIKASAGVANAAGPILAQISEQYKQMIERAKDPIQVIRTWITANRELSGLDYGAAIEAQMAKSGL